MDVRVVLLHATEVAMEPIHQAFASLWPEAELINLLDDGLTVDRAATDEITEELVQRFVALAQYGHGIGAHGILVTCSAFGPAIERAASAVPVPVIKPNEAMFRSALALGNRIGMLATFEPSISSMTEEFHQAAGPDAQLKTILVDGAIEALRQGDVETHNQLIAGRARDLEDCDAILLAHFSTSRAADDVRSVIQLPVFSAPDSAVFALREDIMHGAARQENRTGSR